MEIRKWNYDKKEYDLVSLPDNWKVVCYTNNMDDIVNCPHCGCEIKFGLCYTSMEYHTFCGFGYAVCSICYDKEWERRRKDKGI